MRLGTLLSLRSIPVLALLAAGCSSGGGTSAATLNTALQDLGADADGFTTVLSFSKNPGSVSVGMVAANGGQNPLTVSGSGSTRIVTWDARVTPSHQVRVNGSSEVSSAWKTVTTSDGAAPTFTVTAATQDTGDALLGGDTFQLTFSGARVVESMAEDLSNWQIDVGGNTLDLTGSTFDLDPATQVLNATLGAGANLHAAFDVRAMNLDSVADVSVSTSPVVGAATGDLVAPTLVSSEQRVALDAEGKIVDFVFSEPMDPIIGTQLGRFSVNDHVDATGTTLTASVTQPDAVTLRVTFSKPVVPALDTIDHLGLVDAHGNSIADNTVAIGNTEATVNGYTSVTPNTVANSGSDTIVIVTDHALDPDLAVLPARWTILVAGGGITMADQTLTYDLGTKTLTVELDFDMDNGDTVDVTAVGQVDVDGDAFNLVAGTVNAAGDAATPTVTGAVQNRTADVTGQTADVTFSEDVDPATAQDANNYDVGAGMGTNITSATVLPDGNTVRVVTTTVLTPGDVTFSVDSDVEDLAGNTTGGVLGPIALTSTDSTDPAPVAVTAIAVAGANDDTLTVTFDDDMVQAEAEAHANWTFESPIGTVWALGTETLSYNTSTKVAALRFDAGDQFLRVGDTFRVSFTTMRDIAGNTVDASNWDGSVVGETDRPSAHVVWRDDAPSDDQIIVRFSEPCGPFDDIYHPTNNAFGTQFFAVRDNGGVLRGYPTSATVVQGGLGVRLNYGFIIAMTDTVDVAGLTDLAGNTMFEAQTMPLIAANATAPVQAALPVHTAVAGEQKDTVVVTFNEPMSPWQVTNHELYSLQTQPGAVAIDLSNATFDWDGSTTLTITLEAEDLQAAETYRFTLLNNVDPLRTRTGIQLAALDNQDNTVVGDVTNGPTQGGSAAFLDTAVADSVIVIFDEAVDTTAAEVPGNYNLNGGNFATAVTRVSPRCVRATFAVTPLATQNLVISQASSVDVQGNQAAGDITLAIGTDAAAPLIAGVAGTSVSGLGGDFVTVQFNEPIDPVTGLDRNSYTVTNGTAKDLSLATLTWDSATTTVSIELPPGQDLDTTQALTVTITGVADASGNAMGTPVNLGGVIGGDAAAPTVSKAFVNYAVDPFGGAADVLFDEDVDTTFAGNASNWSSTGVGTIVSVTVIAPDHVRIQTSGVIAPGDLLRCIAGLMDTGKNVTVADTDVDPFDGLE